MEKKKIKLPEKVEYIIDTLKKNGFDAYAVGGCVRDTLLDRMPNDWDITSEAKPEEVINIFKPLDVKVVETGLQHGTVTVVMDKENFEITTYRIDGEYLDNRRPETVIFTPSLEEDLKRRDFTINAMAYNYHKGLMDYHKGEEDLANKIIRCVGEAHKRFNEDGLRMLRAIRFACQLGFELDNEIIRSIKDNFQLLKNISMERIRVELCKILVSNNPAYGIRLLVELNMMKYIIPELYECKDFNQRNKHHDKDVLEHILSVVENSVPRLEIRLAALLHDIGKPRAFTLDEEGQGHFYKHELIGADMTLEILKRLKFDNKTIETVTILVREHMSQFKKFKITSIKKFITRVGIDNLDHLFELQIADIKGSGNKYQDFSHIEKLREECTRIINEKIPLSIKDLKINGKDLMEIGFKQGIELGITLNKLLELVLVNPQLNEKDTLVKLAEEEL